MIFYSDGKIINVTYNDDNFTSEHNITDTPEKAYFSKKDAKLMKALLEKMEANEELPASEEAACAAREDLEQLFENHSL